MRVFEQSEGPRDATRNLVGVVGSYNSKGGEIGGVAGVVYAHD